MRPGDMIQVCPRCGAACGEKAPFENTSRTHGLCRPCFQTEMFRIAAESVARAIEAEPCVLLRVLLLRRFLAVADAAWERSGLFGGK